MKYFRDNYTLTAGDVATAVCRRVIPAEGIPFTTPIYPNGNWRTRWLVKLVQIECGQAAGVTDKQAILITLEFLVTPRMEESCLRIGTGMIGNTNRISWFDPSGMEVAGVMWMAHSGALAAGDNMRIKIGYENSPMKPGESPYGW